MNTLAEIAKVLETTEKNVFNRAAGLRILPVCTRCGAGLDSRKSSFQADVVTLATVLSDALAVIEAANQEFIEYVKKGS